MSPPAAVGATFERQIDPTLAQLERLVTLPNVNLELLDRIWAMSKERRAELARIEFNAAYADMIVQLPRVEQNGVIKIFSKMDRERPGGIPAHAVPIQTTRYSKFDDILQAVIPVLAANGFGIWFEPITTQVGDSFRIQVTAKLVHKSGAQNTATTPPLLHDATGSKNPVQAIGSTLTYAQRYALRLVLPIVSHAAEDADDDGDASGRRIIGVDEIAFVEQQLRDKGGALEQLLAKVGAPSLVEMTADQYRAALEAIEARSKKRKPT
jgi:hypothetical protein